jgi:hypothetical protein
MNKDGKLPILLRNTLEQKIGSYPFPKKNRDEHYAYFIG